MIGRILGAYQIVEKIKDGSVGTVWRCVDARNHTFALKQLSPKNAVSGRRWRRFRREATLTRQFNHRYIIKVYDYVPMKPQPFFTMEYFDGENLKHAMWHLPERVRAREFHILRQIAEALSYLHSLGIVHRDIKPENVLVAPSGEIRLIDFSIAQTAWERLWPWNRRPEGTPLFMAPEQIRGGKCDARTDIYALGATMFELLTRRPPYVGTTQAAIFQKHLSEPVPSMRSVLPTVSSELDALVRRMLAKDPADRPPDVSLVLQALSRWERSSTRTRVIHVEPARR